MNLRSKRVMFRSDGIFSEVFDAATGGKVMVVLEHAYHRNDPQVVNSRNAYPGQEWIPKVGAGTFVCQRGAHRLHGMTADFVTFEITGVTGHQGILFHWGNFNDNSDGCLLTGEVFAEAPQGSAHIEMVTNSRKTFERFMQAQQGLDRITIVVEV